MQALSTWRLASANLSKKPWRSISLALVVAIFAFMLLVGSMISSNLQQGIGSLSARMGADLLVVPQGQGKKIEGVILRAEPSTFYLKRSLLDVIESIPTVERASGQLFISSLDAQCCSVKVQLIGIDQSTDFVVEPWLRRAVERPLTGNEVIVGDYIFGQVGDELTFFDQTFKIVGRLEPTGMGFDSSVFMTMDAARKVGRIASPERADEIDESLSAILVKVKPGVDLISISDAVLDRLGLRANVNFVFASNMMSDTSAKLRNIVSVLYSAAFGVWVVAALVMFVVFFFAFNEREFATLRVLGATKKRVIGIVMTESFMMSAVGTAVGLLLGMLFMELFSVNIAKAIGLPYMAGSGSALTVVLAALAGCVTCPLATLPTAWRIGRKDIYTSLREGE